MKIKNVKEIFDNDEFTTLVLKNGDVVHLPIDVNHSMTISYEGGEKPEDIVYSTVQVDIGG